MQDEKRETIHRYHLPEVRALTVLDEFKKNSGVDAPAEMRFGAAEAIYFTYMTPYSTAEDFKPGKSFKEKVNK